MLCQANWQVSRHLRSLLDLPQIMYSGFGWEKYIAQVKQKMLCTCLDHTLSIVISVRKYKQVNQTIARQCYYEFNALQYVNCLIHSCSILLRFETRPLLHTHIHVVTQLVATFKGDKNFCFKYSYLCVLKIFG